MIAYFKHFFLILLILGCSIAHAQDNVHAAFTADSGAPAIGEPVQLTLTVEVPAQTIVNIPQFPQDWPPFTVKTASDVTVTTENDSSIYCQTLTVILWQPGDYQTPETLVPYQLAGSNDLSQITVDPAFFTVSSVLNDNDLALRPFKPPVALAYISVWFIALMLVGVLAASIAVVYLLRSRRLIGRKPITEDALSNFHIAAQAALRDLKRISDKVSAPADMYAQTADCLRVYLHGRFEVHADDMTTGEIKAIFQSRQILPNRPERELEQLLERADLVKFARAQPKLPAAQQFVAVAQRWIQTIEQADEAKEP